MWLIDSLCDGYRRGVRALDRMEKRARGDGHESDEEDAGADYLTPRRVRMENRGAAHQHGNDLPFGEAAFASPLARYGGARTSTRAQRPVGESAFKSVHFAADANHDRVPQGPWELPMTGSGRDPNNRRSRSVHFADVQRSLHRRIQGVNTPAGAAAQGLPLGRESTINLEAPGTYAFQGMDGAPLAASSSGAASVDPMEARLRRDIADRVVASEGSRQQQLADAYIMAQFSQLLDEAAHDATQRIVRKQLTTTWGAFKEFVNDAVLALIRPLTPAPRGVIKALQRGTPIQIPVATDASDELQLKKIVEGTGKNDEIVKRFSHSVLRYQLVSLWGSNWLNDQVPNIYCDHLVHQYGADRVMSLGTHFFTKLNGGDRAGAHRWTKKKDVFSAAVVLVTIHLSDHWTLAVINNAKGRLEYYDSLGGTGSRMMPLIAEFLDAEWKIKKGTDPIVSHTRWPQISPGKGCPQQNNTVDCGVFVSQFCACIAKGVPFDFSQRDIPALRKMMMLEIIEGKLMNRMEAQ